MIKEKSCGAVVYFYKGGELLFLIEKMKLGHYSLPKGHMENGETEEMTAIREIKEETNLDVDLDTGFRKVITFSPYSDCIKEVVFFVGQARSLNFQKQEKEISELYWLKFDDALALLTYETDQEVLFGAFEYIKKLAN